MGGRLTLPRRVALQPVVAGVHAAVRARAGARAKVVDPVQLDVLQHVIVAVDCGGHAAATRRSRGCRPLRPTTVPQHHELQLGHGRSLPPMPAAAPHRSLCG
eukprot:1149438-Prymnesium_polylepis.1